MAKKPLILDPSAYDLNHVVADIEKIRSHNSQRFEMEQLTAICYEELGHDREAPSINFTKP